jgi:glucose/arabinose dehydrogenase
MRVISIAGLCRFALVLASTGVARATPPQAPERCQLVAHGYGPRGAAPVRAETIVDGLEVPWSVAFLRGGDLLITERPGRVRLLHEGRLVAEPVLLLPSAASGEGGLLGLALHPDFADNRLFYLYRTVREHGRAVNRVERYRLGEDHRSATFDRVIFDGIPAAQYHDGGRLRIGPDRLLYVGTGDGRVPESAEDPKSPSGKLLRLTLDGAAADGNPIAGNPLYLLGVRNTEGWDWLDAHTIVLVDHGPSGEMGRTGHDEVNVVRAGDNLGWPTIYGCQMHPGMITPSLTWNEAVPPGGAALYTGDAIPEWKGSLLIGTLKSRHLHRVVLDRADPRRVQAHEVYFEGDPPSGFGRLRDVVMGPDGQLYVTTSNCDGRGRCPPEKDKLLRIIRAR